MIIQNVFISSNPLILLLFSNVHILYEHILMICTQPASTMTRCLASWIVPAYPPPSLPLQQAPSTGRCTSSPSKHKPNKG